MLFHLVLVSRASAAVDCATYCNAMIATCSSVFQANAGFSRTQLQVCQDECSSFPTTTSDNSTDNLNCRLNRAMAGDCAGASPISTGSNPCVNSVDGGISALCDNYCDVLFSVCGNDSSTTYLTYAGHTACWQACTDFPVGSTANFPGVYPVPAGSSGAEDSQECRRYHVGVARYTDTDLHCTHASPVGNGPCATTCQNFCDEMQATCTAPNQQYSSASVCMSTCAGWNTDGVWGSLYGNNSIQCRFAHLNLILGQTGANMVTYAGIHCLHAGPTGGSYCPLGMTNVATTGATTGHATGTPSSSGHRVVASVFGIAVLAFILF